MRRSEVEPPPRPRAISAHLGSARLGSAHLRLPSLPFPGRPPPRRRARRRAVAAVGVGRLVWLVRLDTVGGRGSARALRRDAAARRPARLAPAARTAVPDGCRRASEGAAGDAGAVRRRLRGGALPARPGVGRGRRQAAAERARVARVPRRVADCGRVRGAPLLEPRRPRGELPRVVGPRLSVGAGAAPAGGQPAAGRLLPRAAPALLLRRGGAAGGEAALARAARAAPHRRRAGAVPRHRQRDRPRQPETARDSPRPPEMARDGERPPETARDGARRRETARETA